MSLESVGGIAVGIGPEKYQRMFCKRSKSDEDEGSRAVLTAVYRAMRRASVEQGDDAVNHVGDL